MLLALRFVIYKLYTFIYGVGVMQCCLVFFREEARNRRAHLISLNAVSFYYVTYIISENCSAVKLLFKYIIQQFCKVFSSHVSGLQLS